MSKIDELIEKKNTDWTNADKRGKKLLICRDVLNILRSRMYSIETRTGYLKIEDPNEAPEGKCDIQKGLLNNEIECTVCARGAMLVSKMRFKNTLSMQSIMASDDRYGYENSSLIDQNMTHSQLKEAFSKEELDMIESVFEKSVYAEDVYNASRGGYSHELQTVLDTFPSDDKDRLKEIMKRIIACDGDVKKALTCKKNESD